MAAAKSERRIFARFTPQRTDARIYADFGGLVNRPAPPIYATFEPAVYERAQHALRDATFHGPTPKPPPGPDLTLDQRLLADIVSLLSPDDYQLQNKYTTGQVQVSFAYDYAIPVWCRHILFTNRSAGSGAAGQLYYWYNLPSAGAKQLPQTYATLTAGQSVSENSEFAWITVFADTTCTDQGWEIRFSGRKEDAMTQSRPGRAKVHREKA